MESILTWRSLDGPVTRDWWALEFNGDRLALVQPFLGRATVRFYLGRQPWQQKQVQAASVQQGRRFAERWLAPRLQIFGYGGRPLQGARPGENHLNPALSRPDPFRQRRRTLQLNGTEAIN